MQTKTTNLINSSAQADGQEQEHPIITSYWLKWSRTIINTDNKPELFFVVELNGVESCIGAEKLAQDVANYPDCYPIGMLEDVKKMAKGKLDHIKAQAVISIEDVPHTIQVISDVQKADDFDSFIDDDFNTVEDEAEVNETSTVQQEEFTLETFTYIDTNNLTHTIKLRNISLENGKVFIGYEVDGQTVKATEVDALAFINTHLLDAQKFEQIEEAVFAIERKWNLPSGYPNGGKLPITAYTFTPEAAKANNLIDRVGRINKDLTAKYFTDHIPFARIQMGEAPEGEEKLYKLHYYKDGIYRIGAHTLIAELLEKLFPEHCTNGLVSEIAGERSTSMGKVARRSVCVKNENLDKDGWRCLYNGILKMPTEMDPSIKFLPHTPSRYFTKKMPVSYDKDAKCPAIEKFIQEVSNGPEMELGLLEYCMWLMSPGYPYNWIVFMVGEGANGKSVFLNLCRSMLGSGYCSAMPISTLTDEHDRFRRSHLYGKMANLCNDTSFDIIPQTGQIKSLSGGQDAITVEVKYAGQFEFINEAKLTFNTNRPPIIEDDTHGLSRRILSFAWTKTFEGKNADPRIFEKLSTPENMSGFLNLILTSFERYKENCGVFSGVRVGIDILQLEANSVFAFADETAELYSFNSSTGNYEDYQVEKDIAFSKYEEWMKEQNGATKVGSTTFFKELEKWAKKHKVIIEDKRVRIDGERTRVLMGIRIDYESKKPNLNNFIKDTSIGIQTT